MRSQTGAVGAIATAVGVAAAALLVALLAALVSRAAWRGNGHLVPWGLVLAVASSASAVVLARGVNRVMGFAAASGWVLGLAVLLAGRPEGDYVVASDGLGEAFLLLATVSVLVTAAWRGRATT